MAVREKRERNAGKREAHAHMRGRWRAREKIGERSMAEKKSLVV